MPQPERARPTSGRRSSAPPLELGHKSVFIADRLALVRQTSLRLAALSIPHGVLRAGGSFGRYQDVQVASAQTIERMDTFPAADLYIVDEAHTMRKRTLDALRASGKTVIGLSATPLTPGLADFYTGVINAETTRVLTEAGWLVPLRVFMGTSADMKGAKVQGGEWTAAEAAERTIPIVGDVISEWVKHTTGIFGMPVKTLAYSATVDDGAELCRQWQAAGYHFEQISYKDTEPERTRKLEGFEKGKILGLVNCEALSKGFDDPAVLCLVDARPYRQAVIAQLQKLGRVMRASPGKEFGLVLDHAKQLPEVRRGPGSVLGGGSGRADAQGPGASQG